LADNYFVIATRCYIYFWDIRFKRIRTAENVTQGAHSRYPTVDQIMIPRRKAMNYGIKAKMKIWVLLADTEI